MTARRRTLSLQSTKRNGYSLVEMMFSIAVGTLVLNAMFPWLVRLLKEGESLSSDISSDVVIQDMIRRLRCDARNASDIEIDGKKIVLIFSDASKVEWDFQSDVIHRVSSHVEQSRFPNGDPSLPGPFSPRPGEGEIANMPGAKTFCRDEFRFSSRVDLRSDVGSSSNRVWLTLNVPRRHHPENDSEKLSGAYRVPIELAIGRKAGGMSE